MIDQLHKDQEAVTATFFDERNSQASELAAEKYDVAEHFMDAIDSDEEIVVDNDPVYTCDREAIGPYCHEQFKSERELELHQKLWHRYSSLISVSNFSSRTIVITWHLIVNTASEDLKIKQY